METRRNQTIAPSIRVKDMQESLDFYTKALGFRTFGRITRQNGRIAHISVGFDSPLLMLSPIEYVRTARTKENFAKNIVGVGVEFYIHMNESKTVDDFFLELKAKGITVINEPKTEFWGDRIFTVRDPDGYALTFSEHVKDVTQETRSTSFDVTHFLMNLNN